MAIQVLASVPSTMPIAREAVLSGQVAFDADGRAHPDGILAREQTAGYGQRGRVWHSAPGESLAATYYFRYGLAEPARAGQIALLAGVAVAETLHQVIGQEGMGLKWPNDALLNKKKVGGILAEMVLAPDGDWVALIGVGINVAARELPPEIAATATSLRLEGVAFTDWHALGEWIADSLRALADVLKTQGFPAVLARWRAFDETPGRRYETVWAGAAAYGTAEGIAEDGALRLRLDNGQRVSVYSATALPD